MNKFLLFVLKILFILPVISVANDDSLSHQQELDLENKKKLLVICKSLSNDKNVASDAEDWESLIRISNEFISSCKDIFGDDELIASSYNSIAKANHALNKNEEALRASELCIRTRYSSPTCHLTKTEILIDLGRKNQARKSLQILEKVNQQALKNALDKVSNAEEQMVKDNYLGKIKLYNTISDYINVLKLDLSLK